MNPQHFPPSKSGNCGSGPCVHAEARRAKERHLGTARGFPFWFSAVCRKWNLSSLALTSALSTDALQYFNIRRLHFISVVKTEAFSKDVQMQDPLTMLVSIPHLHHQLTPPCLAHHTFSTLSNWLINLKLIWSKVLMADNDLVCFPTQGTHLHFNRGLTGNFLNSNEWL